MPFHFHLFALVVFFSASCQVAAQQAYPSKPIRIIVPYAAGGLVDTLARTLGVPVGESMGQPVIVENRPGGSSIIGMLACARAPADGYTLCFTIADSLSYNPHVFIDLPYNAETDFAPVINLARSNNLLVANANAPFNSYKEMIAYARANPAALNWATWGPASLPDMYLQWIKRQAGVDITAIPYKGAAQGNPAVLSGEAHITSMGFGVAGPFLKAGKIKPIVTIGDRRSGFVPNLPTLEEEGGDPGLRNYFGAFTAGKTPRPNLERLNAEFTKAIRSPKLQDLYRASTLEFSDNSPAEFAEYVRRDRDNAGKVFRVMGVRPTAVPQ